MATRRSLAFVCFAAYLSMGATFRSTNFQVEAPTPQIAQQIGQAAEYYRQQKAIEWLGVEMAPWPEKCPLQVKITMNGPGGATSFAFDRGQVLGQHMTIEGPLDRLVASVLPHEVTHTVFAYYFRHPVPRWADEGGAVLSEDDIERDRHDRLVRQILNSSGRKIPLRRLFALQDYPSDVMVLYAEGFSVSNYLVSNSNKRTFLEFIHYGMTSGWDYAVRAYYHKNSVEELEEAWLAHLRATRRGGAVQLAQNTAPVTTSPIPANRVTVRLTVPPILPTSAGIYRGRADDNDHFEYPTQGQPGAQPRYLPESNPNSSQLGYTPLPQQGNPQWQPPRVQLGAPQAIPSPPASLGRPIPDGTNR